jgi:teichuronic acid biosynthesis glycosyltransferase TuaG
MAAPLISVLMTSFNAEAYIEEAIESVLRQDYPNWELLILDDCSKDGTRGLIAGFTDARIRTLHTDTNIGYVASKNRLLDTFRGEYACFLDADDWMADNRLSKQYEVFTRIEGLGGCMCDYWNVRPGAPLEPFNFYPSSRLIDIQKDELNFAGAGILLSRKAVNRIGGFDMYFDRLLGDDSYWAFRLAEQMPFYYLAEPLYFYRANAGSITATMNNMRKLTIVKLLEELRRQRRATGTDWLEQGANDMALAYEASLHQDRKWMAEQYRMAAAVRLDFGDTAAAFPFLKKSFSLNPAAPGLFRTFIYFLKQRAKGLTA